MGIEDIQISEELETNAPSIKYSGSEGPKSPQEEKLMKIIEVLMSQGMGQEEAMQVAQQMMAADAEEKQMAGGQPLPNDPTKPVNPFGPKPTGPVLPDRQMAAYGGIMGVDGRKKYGIGSWFQENIMDPLKVNVFGYDTEYYPEGTIDEFGNDVSGQEKKAKDYTQVKEASQRRVDDEPEGYESPLDTFFKGQKKSEAENPEARTGGILSTITDNIVPIIGGIGAGLFTKNTENDTPGIPSDVTALALDDIKKSANVLDQKQAMAAGLTVPTVASRKYSPTEMIEVYQNAANGGRIGFNMGGGADMGAPQMNNAQVTEEAITKIIQKMQDPNLTDEDRAFLQARLQSFMPQQQMPMMGIEQMPMLAMGGRINRAEGGIMDLGGMEKDYRAEGGFVPIGREEKADDVPARLSVNEFVFTADAVRSAGGGDIDQGAQVMENMMKNLEQGGQVSEESQGMQGARDMFATSERLGEVL